MSFLSQSTKINATWISSTTKSSIMWFKWFCYLDLVYTLSCTRFANDVCGLEIELVPAAERLFIDKTQRVKNARSLHPSPNPHGLVDTVQRSSGKDLLASTVQSHSALTAKQFCSKWITLGPGVAVCEHDWAFEATFSHCTEPFVSRVGFDRDAWESLHPKRSLYRLLVTGKEIWFDMERKQNGRKWREWQ